MARGVRRGGQREHVPPEIPKLKIFRGFHDYEDEITLDKKLSYCWKTVRRESMPRIAEMDVEMTT